MTRLTEALERAHQVPAAEPTQPETPPSSSPQDDLPRTWHFDLENEAPEPVWRTPVLEPAAVVSYQFDDLVKDKLIVGDHADNALVEQYRRLAAVLHHAQVQTGARSVMIASAVAAEGKTLTATNLALTLSHSFQRRVLLIDADLRRPTVHEVFKLPNKVGLNSSLKHPEGGRLPVRRISPTLWVLPAGRPDSDPMSGLVSETMKQLLSDAVDQFDWVVVDTPPVALLPDANLLARMIDSALLVVGASTTPYPLVKRAVDAIGTQRILGVVLNRIEKTQLNDSYGYYGYYYYRRYASTREPRVPFRLRLPGRKA
jgi:receptor protein-tyrosine kinase